MFYEFLLGSDDGVQILVPEHIISILEQPNQSACQEILQEI